MKAIAWLAAGVVLGFMLGGIPARREASALRQERDALAAQLADAARPNLLQALLPRLDAAPATATPSSPVAPAPARAAGAPGPRCQLRLRRAAMRR